ncbi:MAG: hypothetical protein ABIQ61_04070 [Ornithinibacter sp.]
MSRRRTARQTRLALSALAASALLLSGCGAQNALVGLHPAPPEASTSAPLDAEGAAAIATRLLAQARVVAAQKGTAGDAARAKILAGDALTVANAAAARGAAAPPPESLEVGPEPTLVGQSQGREWPRAILAATLDDATNVQFLHVMVSTAPVEPFRIVSQVPMLAGSELPALAAPSEGAPMLATTSKEGLPGSPEEVVKAYAAALAHPKPTPSDLVTTTDPFAVALKASAAAQSKALGALGTLTQTHTPDLKGAVSFRLADGGAVTFALMRRTDTYKASAKAKELTLPADLAALSGKKKVTSTAEFGSLEPIAMVLPPTSGAAEAIAASDLLVSGKGR